MGKPKGIVRAHRRFIRSPLLCLCILAACGHRSNPPEDAERLALVVNGVHTVIESKSSVFVGRIQPPQLLLERQLDTTGQETQATEYGERGLPECIRRYYYDADGKLLLVYARGADGKMLYKIAHRYTNGSLSELCFHLPDGSFKYRQTYEYDGSGRLVTLSWYWPTGLRSRNRYTYQGDRKVSDEEYDADNRLSYRWTFSYDAESRQIDAVQIAPNGKETRRIRTYYNGDNLRLQQFYVDGHLQDAMVYRFDERGLHRWRCNLNASGRATALYSYKYLQRTAL